MAKDVLAASEAARRVFAQADEALGEPLSRLVFDGPEEDLTRTANAQPALVTASIALLEALRERHPAAAATPAFVAGHSLGEFSALVAAGALSFADAIRVVRARGLAMQRAVPEGEGAMVAVLGLELDVVQSICTKAAEGDVLAMANHNAPGQIALSGHAAAVDRACDLVDEAGGRAIVLNVSAPFHSPLMKPAAEAVRAALADVTVRAPACPVVTNVDAEPTDDPATLRAHLVRQVDAPVLWDRSIRRMAALGVGRILEIGPGTVLAGLGKRIEKTLEHRSINTLASLDDVARAITPAPAG